MITRDEVNIAVAATYGFGHTKKVDAIMQLIEVEQAKYQSLVDATVDLYQFNPLHYDRLRLVLMPFIPPPLLSDKLDNLSDTLRECSLSQLEFKIRQLAAEARELEK